MITPNELWLQGTILDIEKLVAFLATHASTYVQAFGKTLVRPSIYFLPVPSEGDPLVVDGTGETRINPQLFEFVAISIVIGAIMSNVLSLSPVLVSSLGVLVIMAVAMWLLFGAGVHVIAKALGGRGSFAESASATLQVLSVIFVSCNTLALAGRVISHVPWLKARWSIDPLLLELGIYLPVQLALLLVYIPIVVRSVHRIPGRARSLVFFLGAWIIAGVGAGGLMYLVSGARYAVE